MRPFPLCLLGALLDASAMAPALAAPVQFDLPAQPAGAALIAFAKQADVEILFASGALKQARAAEVRGPYEPERALALLLAGTGFTATQADAGKFVVSAIMDKTPAANDGAGALGRLVELPPLTVTAAEEQPWDYLAIPGYEILSRCNLTSVVHWAREVARLHRALGVMLPDDLRFQTDVPTGVLLYDLENRPGVSREVVADMERANGSANSRNVAYRSLPNMRLSDKDAMGFFFILDSEVFRPPDPNGGDADMTLLKHDPSAAVNLKLKPEHIYYLAKNRTPALPGWFVNGVVDLFETANFNRESVVTMAPLVWITPEETKSMRTDPERRQKMMPLAELFSGPPPGPDPGGALRRAEAELFIRWGLAGRNQPRKKALWKFVRQASTAPPTEAVFRECFGFGYEEAEQKLGDYLLPAVIEPLQLVPPPPVPLPALNPRRATALEIARIKGDWDRLEIGYVKSHYPELTPRYVAQARRTLRRAYDAGERDPRLLAVMGLCECDAGDDAAARPFLEAAVRGGVSRPRVNYELARLRYAEAKAQAALSGGKLSPAQSAAVLEPLAPAYREHPPLLEIYALTAEVWGRSALPLTRRDLDLLGEGIALFPWNAPLVYQAAWLNGVQGFKAEADALIAHGLKVTANAALAARYERLRAALAAGRSLTGAAP